MKIFARLRTITPKGRILKSRLKLLLAIAVLANCVVVIPNAAHASNTLMSANYTVTPPQGLIANGSGGDGYSLAVKGQHIYTAYHHNTNELQILCKTKSGDNCWSLPDGLKVFSNYATSLKVTPVIARDRYLLIPVSKLVQDVSGENIVGIPGIFCLDLSTESTAGASACSGTAGEPSEFSALGSAGDVEYSGVAGSFGGLGSPVIYGSKIFVFNSYFGEGPSNTTSNPKNALLCLDLTTWQSCGPILVNFPGVFNNYTIVNNLVTVDQRQTVAPSPTLIGNRLFQILPSTDSSVIDRGGCYYGYCYGPSMVLGNSSSIMLQINSGTIQEDGSILLKLNESMQADTALYLARSMSAFDATYSESSGSLNLQPINVVFSGGDYANFDGYLTDGFIGFAYSDSSPGICNPESDIANCDLSRIYTKSPYFAEAVVNGSSFIGQEVSATPGDNINFRYGKYFSTMVCTNVQTLTPCSNSSHQDLQEIISNGQQGARPAAVDSLSNLLIGDIDAATPVLPYLSNTGVANGFCLGRNLFSNTRPAVHTYPYSCYNFEGVDLSSSMPSFLSTNDFFYSGGYYGLSGSLVVDGPRVFSAQGDQAFRDDTETGLIDCIDFSKDNGICTYASASNNYKQPLPGSNYNSSGAWGPRNEGLQNRGALYLYDNANSIPYSITIDPEIPDCLWVASNAGGVVNFDAATGASCDGSKVLINTTSILTDLNNCSPVQFESYSIADETGMTSETLFATNQSGIHYSSLPNPTVSGVSKTWDLTGITFNSPYSSEQNPNFILKVTFLGTPPESFTVVLKWFISTPQASCYVTSDPNVVINQPTTHTVNFYSNSGIFSDESTIQTASGVSSGTNALSIKPGNPTRSGYRFLGWAVGAGSSTVVTSYEIVGDANLYAQWGIAYTASFYSNGGTFEDNSTVQSSVPLAAGTDGLSAKPTDPSRPGYGFLGWTAGPSSSTVVTTYPLSSNTDFYAKWGASYTVRFDSNGGLFSDNSATRTIPNVGAGRNALDFASENPLRNGYSFAGWAVGSGSTTIVNSYSVNSNIEMYAQWQASGGGGGGGGGYLPPSPPETIIIIPPLPTQPVIVQQPEKSSEKPKRKVTVSKEQSTTVIQIAPRPVITVGNSDIAIQGLNKGQYIRVTVTGLNGTSQVITPTNNTELNTIINNNSKSNLKIEITPTLSSSLKTGARIGINGAKKNQRVRVTVQ